jgi:serine/threonine protein kinase
VSSPSASLLAKHANCLPVGTRVSDFEIVDLIGEGGFGIVYLAKDIELDRAVAIKEFMPAAFAGRVDGIRVAVRAENHRGTFEAGLKSFINEAKLLAKFSHPALLEVFRFWEGNGTAYMAMRHYEGTTLRQALDKKDKQFSEEEIAHIIGPILDALEMLHRDQIYHRDIAPDNIMLTDGRSVLLDFGSARRILGDATQALTTVLKPGYAPIEQYTDDGSLRQGAWTDVYALGAVLYHVATGKAPVQAVSRMLSDPLVDVAKATQGRFSESFSRAVAKAMSVHVSGRFQSVTELREALGWDVGMRPRVVTLPSQQIWLNPENAPRSDAPKTAQPVTLPKPIVSDPPAPSRVDRTEVKSRRTSAVMVGAVAVVAAVGMGAWVLNKSDAGASTAPLAVNKESDSLPSAFKDTSPTRPEVKEAGKAAIDALVVNEISAADKGEGTIRFAMKQASRIDINGITRGVSSALGDVKLPAGTHTIDIFTPGSQPVTRTIEVKKDALVVVN